MNRNIIIGILLSCIVTACNNNTPGSTKNNKATDSTSFVPAANWKVNGFDRSIINFCQKFVHKNQQVDNFIGLFTYNYFLKGGLIILLFWWLWFLPGTDEKKKQRHTTIMLALFSCLTAVVFTRILVHALPFRVRPISNSELQLVLPYGTKSYDDNSFPSDHAAMMFALSYGLFFVSKKWGIISMLYITFFPLFARIYDCYHYPTDIIAGALFGTLITFLVFKIPLAKKIANKFVEFSYLKPQFFYPVFFFVLFQITTMFDDIRNTLSFFWGHDL